MTAGINMSDPVKDKDGDIIINPIPEDLTQEEADQLLAQDIRKEFFAVAQELEKHHGLFAQIWEVGFPRLTFEIPTAAVTFNSKGEQVEFIFNPIFWRDTDRYTKCFIICHEILHVILSHGFRARDCAFPTLANKALDVVVNHTLTSKFGFNRELIDVGTYPDNENVPEELRGQPIELCWIDNVFQKMSNEVEHNKPFEYYYRILEEHTKFIESKMCICNSKKRNKKDSGRGKQQKGQGGENQSEDEEYSEQIGKGKNEYSEMGGSVLDEHGKLNEFDSDNAKDKISDDLDKKLDPEEKEDLHEKIGKTEEGDAAEKAEEQNNKQKEESNQNDGGNPGGNGRGSIAGRLAYQANTQQRVQKKRKWEEVIKRWARKYKEDEREIEQWARTNRRYATMNYNIMLPTYMPEEKRSENRIDVWFFQDTSGSCMGYHERFFKAARTLPEDKFKIHLYCFDTRVYETSLETGKLYGFGGTSFDILENYIQNKLNKEEIKRYPDAVFVITDGMGNRIHPEKPERWYWFLTNSHMIQCIPEECNIFDLANFE